jgi:hypothetical protein
VPVAIESVKLPFRFRGVHTPSLLGWDGSKDLPEFRTLVEDIAAIVGLPATKRQQGPTDRQPESKLKPGTVFGDKLKDGSQGPDAKHMNAPASQDILREGYHDRQVEEVRTQLNQLHTKAHDPATFLRSKMFAILRGLFVGRNTFIEPADECREESWAERFIATIETRRLIQTYRPVIIEHAKPGDEELVRSYDQLNLHRYVQELTGLFDPRPSVYKITEQLSGGNVDKVKLELKGAEIHPKERIDLKVIEACNKRQSEIKGIWEQWPVM